MNIRKIFEMLARGRSLKRHIKVNGLQVPLWVSPDAQLKYLKPGDGSFDGDLIRIAEKHLSETSIVWDVGANVGVFTFAASAIARSGTVLSVEADCWLATLLRKTRRLPFYSERDVRILPVAVGAEDSVAQFQIAARGRASNSLKEAGGRSTMGGVRELQYVPTLTLDTLRATQTAPGFIKIDIDGAELFALRGGTRLLSEVRPIFYIEVGRDVSKEVFDLFSGHGYHGFSEEYALLSSNCASNSFFVPSEKLDTFRAQIGS